jgi:hypothetical protein
LIQVFDSVSKLGSEERPAALATAINSVSAVHYYGILGYYIGVALMVYFLKKGYKREAGLLWIMAITTVILVCYNKFFFIGILTAVVLIWKRKLFRPTPTPIETIKSSVSA